MTNWIWLALTSLTAQHWFLLYDITALGVSALPRIFRMILDVIKSLFLNAWGTLEFRSQKVGARCWISRTILACRQALFVYLWTVVIVA